jgi:LysM repeat protein
MATVQQIRAYRVPAIGVLAALALSVGIAAPLVSAPPAPLAVVVEIIAPVQDESRAAEAPAAVPSVRGVLAVNRAEVLRGPRPAPVRGTPLRLGMADEDGLIAADAALRSLSNSEGFLVKQTTPNTIAARRLRKDIIVYTVEEGDNVSTLAERFDISTDTIVWANGDLDVDPDFILIGDKLNILPVPGVLHTVKDGDTVESIAKTYKADPLAIMEYDWNKLTTPHTLKAGQKIIVPDGEKPYAPRLVYLPDGRTVMVGAPRGLGRFVWPTQGYITSRFGEDGHRGLDIAAYMGAPIYAADAGVVTYSGLLGNYGLAVVIDHGNGYQSLYGHLSVYYPRVGQAVKRGQAIGKMGSTGKSTGPHLHLEITYWGGLVNPAAYLP